ncbi:MAG: phosphate ABC transporter permease subunit PstC [Gemmatimonadota bacterium]
MTGGPVKSMVGGTGVLDRFWPAWARGNTGDRAFGTVLVAAGAAIPAVFALLLYEVGRAAWPAVRSFGATFLTSTAWDPVAQKFGALPFLWGTVVSSLLALLLAVPLGLGVAVFLVELAPRWLATPVGFLTELLAAIPSVVYGLWGIFVLIPWLRTSVEPFLQRWLGFLPMFQGPAYGVGMLAAGVILAIMIVPFISAVSGEMLLAVPRSEREASLALGATRWETVRYIVMPHARSGIVGAVMLGLGRALGETMAVTMVIGNNPSIDASLFAPANTLASALANEFAEATGELHLGALMELGLILLLLTVAVNVVARVLVWRIERGRRV